MYGNGNLYENLDVYFNEILNERPYEWDYVLSLKDNNVLDSKY